MKASSCSVQQNVSPVHLDFTLFTRWSHWYMLKSHNFIYLFIFIILFFKLCQLQTSELHLVASYTHWGRHTGTAWGKQISCCHTHSKEWVLRAESHRLINPYLPSLCLSLIAKQNLYELMPFFVMQPHFILGPVKGDLKGLDHLEHLEH